MSNHLIRTRGITRRQRESGFSVTEMLVVLALMGIFITFAGPAFTQSYRAYKVRSAAQELVLALRAARQVAVSTRAASSLVVNTASRNYSWTDVKGRTRLWELPVGVNFISATPSTITFATNGTVTTGAASVVLQVTVTSSLAHRWTVDLNTAGRVSSSLAQVIP